MHELAGLALFSGVPDNVLEQLKPEMVSTLIDGDFLVKQGEGPRFLHVILDGRVDISTGPDPITRIFIGSRQRGAVVGEQAFIESTVHSADVVARGHVSALKIPAAVANTLLGDSTFSRNLLQAVSSKLREATSQRYRYLAENSLLFSHFRSHVDARVVDELLRKGGSYGEPRYVDPAYVMFCDLRDFTRLSQAMSELALAEQLEPYFSAVVASVHDSFGIVDKYIGDAVMAVWGHPALGPIDANNVLDTCLSMARQVSKLAFGGQAIRLGIGLNAGRVFMGNVGNDEKQSFTVLGNTVNLAARYEAANKASDATTYLATIGPAMYDLLDQGHRALFLARPDTLIKGVPGDRQTVYSLRQGAGDLNL